LSTAALPHIIGYEFARGELFEEALTHPSALSPERRRRRCRTPVKRSYERLEFLGDRVLGLVVADCLWNRFEGEPEGDLTRRHTHLVRREAIARVAETIDACEALIAAIYLDGGFGAASAFVRRFWEPLIEEMAEPPRDPKTALQEWAQARGLALPAYELVATSGPDHAPLFTMRASVVGADPVTATASSKRNAEAKAAASLLDHLTAA